MLAVVTVDTVDDVVDFNDGFTSLREAVFATNLIAGADEVQFDFGIDGPASLVLTEGELAITDALTIRGDGADLLTIDGNGNRIFNVDDGDLSTDAHFTVVGVTLTGGDAGRDRGGAIRSVEGLTVESSEVVSNVADFGGGGIYVGSSLGEVTILDTAVADNNSRDRAGGGVWIHTDGDVTITGSTLFDNTGGAGGGAFISSGGLITLTENVVSENLSAGASPGGGGLFINASGLVNIEGNTFTLNRTGNFRGAGGGLNVRGTGVLTVRGNTITDNAASGEGGGMAIFLTGIITVEDNQLVGNRTDGNGAEGGGLYVIASGLLTVSGNTITDNKTDATSAQGGGLYIRGSGILTISGNTITDNRTDGNRTDGGGAAIIFTGSATVSDNVIARNRTDGNSAQGGGIYIQPTGIAKIANNEIMGNSASGTFAQGHGIYAVASNATVEISGNNIVGNTHSTERDLGGIATETTDTGVVVISGNTVTGNKGGIIVTGSGSTAVSRNLISENLEVGLMLSAYGGARIQTARNTITNHTTERSGAGISVYLTESTPSSVSIVDTTVAGNESLNLGGGIFAYVRAGHNLEISRSTISGNTSARRGGGIWLDLSGGSVSLEQVTVSGNSTNESGGGIYFSPQVQNETLEDEDLGELTIRHSTITQNTANPDHSDEEGGGGIYFGERATLSHTIVAGNEGGRSLADDIFGDFEGDFNLVGVGSESLGPLADNGGSTQTHALLPGSPAIDAGDPTITSDTEGVPALDQRGFQFRESYRRVIDQIDIGAYEAQIAPSADFDSDGDVDGADFLTWQRGYGSTFAQRADGNSDDDRDIDASDLAAWKVSFGQPQTPSAISNGQPELADDLIDAALAVEWLSRSEPIERDMPVLEVVIEPTISPPAVPVDTMKSAVGRPAIIESGATGREPNQSSDHPWLSEELLEQVFGQEPEYFPGALGAAKKKTLLKSS